MTNAGIIKIAKRSSCTCAICGSRVWNRAGAPVFGNGKYDCKIGEDGKTYCSTCASYAGIKSVIIPTWKEKDRITDESEKIQILSSMDEGAHFECYDEHVKHRAFKEEGGTFFVYGKKKRHYGYRYDLNGFIKLYDLKADAPSSSPEYKWKARIRRAIKCLSESGLWPELIQKLQNLSLVSYDDREEIKKAFWEHWDSDPNPTYSKFLSKYPFIFSQKEDGNIEIADTFYIYEMSDVILKSMYFGKGRNEEEKKMIKEKIEKKEDWTVTARTSYDVSFSYKAVENKAWYAEEYKGCGNGHYSIALNHNTAWFCEND